MNSKSVLLFLRHLRARVSAPAESASAVGRTRMSSLSVGAIAIPRLRAWWRSARNDNMGRLRASARHDNRDRTLVYGDVTSARITSRTDPSRQASLGATNLTRA